MPHTCCVPSCNYGYRLCTDKQKYAMFGFSKDAIMKNKSLSAIPHKNWTITETLGYVLSILRKKILRSHQQTSM